MIIIYAKKILSLEDQAKLVKQIRDELKTNKISKDIAKEHGFNISIVDGIVIEFDEDLDVSAKTVNSKISINPILMNDGFDTVMRYAIHEFVHALQHLEREGFKDKYENFDYLDRPDEIEAFKAQVQFQKETEGEDAAKDYVYELVEYHDMPESDAEDKAVELLEE